jgi:hypothetical protein
MKCEMCKREEVCYALYEHRVCDLCYNCLKYDYVDPDYDNVQLPKHRVKQYVLIYKDSEYCFFTRECDDKVSFTHIEKGVHVYTSKWEDRQGINGMSEYWRRLRSIGARRVK